MKSIPLSDYYRSALLQEAEVSDYRSELPEDQFVGDARRVAATLKHTGMQGLVALASGAGDVECGLRDEFFGRVPLIYVDSSEYYLEQAMRRPSADECGDRALNIDLFDGSGGALLRRQLDAGRPHLFLLLGGTFSNFPMAKCAALFDQVMSDIDVCVLDFGALIDTPAAVDSRELRYRSISRATRDFFSVGMRQHDMQPQCYDLEVQRHTQGMPNELTYVTLARRNAACEGDAVVELNRVNYYDGAHIVRTMENLGFAAIGGNVFDVDAASLLRRYLVLRRKV